LKEGLRKRAIEKKPWKRALEKEAQRFWGTGFSRILPDIGPVKTKKPKKPGIGFFGLQIF
jgi:hypothetical protein